MTALEKRKRYLKCLNISCICIFWLFLITGFIAKPCFDGIYLESWIYIALKKGLAAFSVFGIGTASIVGVFRSVNKPVLGFVLWKPSAKKKFCGILFAFLQLSFCLISFLVGIYSRAVYEIESTDIYKGEIIDINDYPEYVYDIYFIDKEGNKIENLCTNYKVDNVEPRKISIQQKIFDWIRYSIYALNKIEPLDITVEPNDCPFQKDTVIVKFADPLVSHGEEVLLWSIDDDLLGADPSSSSDFTPLLEYSTDGKHWVEKNIFTTEMAIEPDKPFTSVILRWTNNWSLSKRNLLNYQYAEVKNGEIQYLFYPGERFEFNLDILRGLCSCVDIDSIRSYSLTLESQNQNVGGDKALDEHDILSSSEDGVSCIVKTGRQIIYHCYYNGTDLGYFEITLGPDESAFWRSSPDNEAEIVLKLDIS